MRQIATSLPDPTRSKSRISGIAINQDRVRDFRYGPPMQLPFDAEQFFAVFAAYNAVIWPAQLLAYGLGLAAIVALLFSHPVRERMILSILALMWAWNGLAYHLVEFASVNPAAHGFALLFMMQAAIFAFRAIVLGDLRFEMTVGWRSVASIAFMVYSLLIYEVIGVIFGHGLMQGPLFGVAPCPSTIFTIGLLLLANGRSQVWLSGIPLLWAAIGTGAAVLLDVVEDLGLGIAGLTLVLSLVLQAWASRQSTGIAD